MSDSQFFLWRGPRRLGALHLRDIDRNREQSAASRGDLHAVLIPGVDPSELASVRQEPPPFRPDSALRQRPLTIDIIAERPHVSRAADGAAARGTAIAARDVTLAEEYTVRDQTERLLPFQAISIRESRLIPGREAETLGDLPMTVLVRGSVWTVSAFRLAAI